MTGNEVFRLALSLLIGKPADYQDPQEYALMWINLLMEEALPYENSILIAEGEEPFTATPYIENMEEEIPYHDSIVRVALPYGVASYCWIDDDKMNESELYRARYIAALNDAKKYIPSSILDAYAGDEEDGGKESCRSM